MLSAVMVVVVVVILSLLPLLRRTGSCLLDNFALPDAAFTVIILSNMNSGGLHRSRPSVSSTDR